LKNHGREIAFYGRWIEDVERAAGMLIGATREVRALWIASKEKSH
jgi:hypothetical protein